MIPGSVRSSGEGNGNPLAPRGKPSETMELSTKAGSCTGHSWLQKQTHTQARQLCIGLQGHMAKKEKKKRKKERTGDSGPEDVGGSMMRTYGGEVSAEEVPSWWVLEGVKYKR